MSTETQDDVDVTAVPSLTDVAELNYRAEWARTTTRDAVRLRLALTPGDPGRLAALDYVMAATQDVPAYGIAAVLQGLRDVYDTPEWQAGQ